MDSITVTRKVSVPDPERVERYRRFPETGPKMLFFSGGTAMNRFSRILKRFTHNSIHLLTPFDSGGSSAKLREAFGMLAVGDIRSRLIALADESVAGSPEAYRLANYRLPKESSEDLLLQEFDDIVKGRHPLSAALPKPLGDLIRLQLDLFQQTMPANFDLRGASIGNLILTGGYFNYQHQLEPILFLFSKLLTVKGTVLPITEDSAHLVAELATGEEVIGQHLITGKEVDEIKSPIVNVSLSSCNQKNLPVAVKVTEKISGNIMSADLICYPPGSFYSSIIANLLPEGVGRSIVSNICPKVYVPNMGEDPEQLGMSILDQVNAILYYLRLDAGEDTAVSDLLNIVLIDSDAAKHFDPLELSKIEALGIRILKTQLVSSGSYPFYNKHKLADALLSLC